MEDIDTLTPLKELDAYTLSQNWDNGRGRSRFIVSALIVNTKPWRPLLF